MSIPDTINTSTNFDYFVANIGRLDDFFAPYQADVSPLIPRPTVQRLTTPT